MSLKAFHIFFIVVSILLGFSVGYWSLGAYQKDPSPFYILLTGFSFLGSLGLAFYLSVFLKKSRQLAFLMGALLIPKTGWACAVCFGNANSSMTQAASVGVLFLLAVVGVILAAVAGLFFSWIRKEQKGL